MVAAVCLSPRRLVAHFSACPWVGLRLWCRWRAVCVQTTRVALSFCWHRIVSQGADSSVGGWQQHPRGEGELMYSTQRGKIPGPLQQIDQKTSLQGCKGWRAKQVPAWLIQRRELLSARGASVCPTDIQGKLPNYLALSSSWQLSCTGIARMIKADGLFCVCDTRWCSRMRALSAFLSSWSLTCWTLTDCPTDWGRHRCFMFSLCPAPPVTEGASNM